MSAFLERNHLFLRNPAGGVEDVHSMVLAGFGLVLCNIGDHGPDEWQVIRNRCEAERIPCGPWMRTASGSNEFDPAKVEQLVHTAELWGDAPFVVNSESEIKGSGSEITGWIARMCYGHDWALSMECWPFANVDWSPIALVLPQIFPQEAEAARDPEGCRAEWHRVGVPCVVNTYGSYHEWDPGDYDRLTPYGVYTADDCGQNYAAWGPDGTHDPCQEEPVPDEPEWWEKGYPGGPMVKVKGFPRAVYPPDAAAKGKTPSVDGPDIVAYKRCVSRAGRWPWQAFDDTFSNGFSHGRSGNVGESGVAGVQRQGKLDPTGWIGEKTFNLLRSIRIPEGLPHAGEPAMDAVAVGQINDAFELFSAPEGGATRCRLSDHFIVEEFDCNDGTLVPAAYYDALRYLCATFLEPLHAAYGPVTINSGYRTPSYNADVGGESNSFHIYTAHDTDDVASDVACAKGSPSNWHAKLDSIRQAKGGNGGLGLYPTFCHIDTRDYPSDWSG